MPSRIDRSWVPPTSAEHRGVFTLADAVEAGLTWKQARHRVAQQVWRPVCGDGLVHTDVQHDPWHDAHAATVTWPDATVALTSAALLHGLPVGGHDVHVVIPERRVARQRVRPHRHVLEPGDVVVRDGVRLTSLTRTLVDCLGWLPRREASRLLAWVGTRQLLDADELDRWTWTHPGRRGNVQRSWMADRLRRGALSEAEDLLHGLLHGAGITGWAANASLLDDLGVAAVVDVWFPAARVVVEVDGRVAHGDDRFQHDRTRQNLLVGAGCIVLRYTWDDLTLRPGRVVAQIRQALEAAALATRPA